MSNGTIDATAWDRLLASTAVQVDGLEAREHRGRRFAFDDWSPSALRGLVVLLAVAGLLVAWWWWSGRPVAVAMAPVIVATGSALPATDEQPSAIAVTAAAVPSPDPSPAQVVVHVAGLVARPGLVRLPAGSRVADAVAAAGGVTKPRAAESVNLARVVADGEQIVVSLNPSADVGRPLTTAESGLIDLNTASAEQLEQLPGVGPVLAQRITQWRTDNGPFRSVDELGEVSGIGDSTLAELTPHVRL